MPNRIIRDSARTSPTLDQLSDGAERMFWRLTTVADDFGRFEADPRVVLSTCFPLKTGGQLRVASVRAWLTELVQAGIVLLYRVGEKTYGEFKTWAKHQRLRATTSKYPPPSSADIGGHPRSSAAGIGIGIGIGDGSGNEEVKPSRPARAGGRAKGKGAPQAPAPTSETWEAYSEAYKQRYHADPVRNAAVNGQLAQVVKRLGATDAPPVAAFYVQHNAARYVAAGHPVRLLLFDAEKLRTEWATGRRITETAARQADQQQNHGDIAQRLIARYREEESHGQN